MCNRQQRQQAKAALRKQAKKLKKQQRAEAKRQEEASRAALQRTKQRRAQIGLIAAALTGATGLGNFIYWVLLL